MRILTVVRDLGIRGTQRAAQNFSLAYRRAGHDVAVLAHEKGGPRQPILEHSSIPVFVGGANLATALRLVNRFEPDIIHIHRPGEFNHREATILRGLRRGRRVVLETSVFGRVDYSRDADLVDVHAHVSGFCLWRWRRRLGWMRRHQLGVFIPNPMETTGATARAAGGQLSQRRDWRIPDTAFVCGHVGSKLSSLAIDGFVRLADIDQSARLVCVAVPSALRPQLEAMPDSVRQRVVIVPGTCDDAELFQIYSSFDCLLHAPFIGETFGYVVAEALLNGVAVASMSRPHHDNGHLEVIGHREGGLIAGSSKHFATAIIQLRRDDELRRRVATEGPERIKRLFDSDALAERALRVARLAQMYPVRQDLKRALERDPMLETDVDARTIMGLLSNTLGGPSRRELALMSLVNSPTGQRLVRLLRHRELLALRP